MYWLGARMDNLSFLEINKLDLADQPDSLQNARDPDSFTGSGFHTLTELKRSDTWTYWDSEIPKWYRTFETSEANKAEKA